MSTVYEGTCATREDAERLVAEVSRRYGRVAYITHEPGQRSWHVFSTLS